jgi:hypothetical protein
MAPGVYKAFVAKVLCSALAFEDNMVRLYGFSRYKLDSTQGAPIFLSLEQHQPLFRVGFPSYLSLLALYPVLFERWVIRRISPYDFSETGDRGLVGLSQFGLSIRMQCPVAVTLEVACFHPGATFIRVSALCPVPEHLPLGMSDFLEDSFGCTVSVIVRPSAYDGVERLNYLHRRGLLMCVQVGAYGPGMFQDFFLLWDGQQCSPLPEFPDVKPQEVKPFRDMHHTGFDFTECQSSFFKELFQSWSGICFQYFPCWGRGHKVVGVANNRYAFVDASALGWGFGPSICIFRIEQPFHPVQCHICQQWRDYPSLWCSCVCWREESYFDHSRFQPVTQRGGEHWQFGQQGAMVNVVKGFDNLIPPSTTHSRTP